MISTIVFSKDRPLQLEGYLTSLMHYSGIKSNNINVLYKGTNEISYDRLISKYPDINWVAESNYSEDLKRLISDAEDFILFGCDDVFFKEYFNINHPVETLRKDDSLFAFHLRLGVNIEGCPKVQDNLKFIKWDWTATKSMHWNYPWEVSAAVYRKEDVLKIINSIDFSLCRTPNYFEDLIFKGISAGEIKIQSHLASFHSGKALTLTVNRVQDDYKNPFDKTSGTSVEELYQYFEDGMFLDWRKFENKINTYIHVDSAYFSLTKEDLSLQERRKPELISTNSVNRLMKGTQIGFGLKILIVKNKVYRKIIRLINIVNPDLLLSVRKIRKRFRNAQ